MFQQDPFADAQPFLSEKYNFGLQLNVDWFSPFQRSSYKVGGIYVTILNLPRAERSLSKWTMLIGLMPRPNKAKGNINSFIRPLVNDMLELWKGVQLLPHKEDPTVREALLCVSCDLPATRKKGMSIQGTQS